MGTRIRLIALFMQATEYGYVIGPVGETFIYPVSNVILVKVAYWAWHLG